MLRGFLLVAALTLASAPAFGQLLGFDHVIDSGAAGSQVQVRTATAFNGWLFAAYNHNAGGKGGITIRKSVDNGLTWKTIDNYDVAGTEYPVFDLVVAGTSSTDLRLFLAGVNHSAGSYVMYVDQYNAATGHFDGSPLNVPNGSVPINDIAIASDYLIPAVNITPYSIALAYSQHAAATDDIQYYVSLDAGATFQSPLTVVSTAQYLRKLSLAYGRSASGSNGRYFVAWEQLANETDVNGSIYESRTQPLVTSAFITPVALDQLSASTSGLCRDPSIALMQEDFDSSGAGVTGVVLATCDATPGVSTVNGFYNPQAHFSNTWSTFSPLGASAGSQLHPHVIYNRHDHTFVFSYNDSAGPALPYLSNDFNLTSPNSWTVGSSNYADLTTGISSAAPRVGYSPFDGTVNFAWINHGAGGDVAYLDSNSDVIFRDGFD